MNEVRNQPGRRRVRGGYLAPIPSGWRAPLRAGRRSGRELTRSRGPRVRILLPPPASHLRTRLPPVGFQISQGLAARLEVPDTVHEAVRVAPQLSPPTVHHATRLPSQIQLLNFGCESMGGRDQVMRRTSACCSRSTCRSASSQLAYQLGTLPASKSLRASVFLSLHRGRRQSCPTNERADAEHWQSPD